MKLTLSTVLKNLQGEELKNPDNTPVTVGGMLGTLLSQAKEKPFGQQKQYILSHDLFTKKHIEIDDADYKKLIEFLEKVETTALIGGQLIQLLEQQKKV